MRTILLTNSFSVVFSKTQFVDMDVKSVQTLITESSHCLTHIVGLDVLVGVFHPIIHHHHCDSLARDVALPHPRYVDIHAFIEVIVLQEQEQPEKHEVMQRSGGE